jgi:hypothetical protein
MGVAIVGDGMRMPRLPLIPLLAGLALFVAACVGEPVPPTPSPGQITSPDEAARRVLAEHPRFGEVPSRNPDLIGQCCWYEASEVEDGYEVLIRFGWGDCPAGCINEHRWTYHVSQDGEVELVDERGDPLEPGVLPGMGTS